MFHFNLHHIILILNGYLFNISCSPLPFGLVSSQVSGNGITFSHVELPSSLFYQQELNSIARNIQFEIFFAFIKIARNINFEIFFAFIKIARIIDYEIFFAFIKIVYNNTFYVQQQSLYTVFLIYSIYKHHKGGTGMHNFTINCIFCPQAILKHSNIMTFGCCFFIHSNVKLPHFLFFLFELGEKD